MKAKLSFILPAVLTALFVAGCGGGDNNQRNGTANESEAPAAREPGASTTDAQATAEVVIEANDQMQFNIDNFVVEPGETVRLTLKNVGTMPKFSMGHNVVILVKGADPAAFAEAAMNAAATDYVPSGREADIIAHTKLLGGGEEDTITFTAPEETGEYPFLCSFPGHFQIGMQGTMTVQ